MSYENANIETIARGVLIIKNQLLVCVAKDGTRCYLPGGHIEFGETGRQALEREIKEEMGLDAKAGKFIAVSEDSFMQGDEKHCEINLLFALEIPGLLPPAPPSSAEEWISFKWVPLTKLAEANLLPAHLIKDVHTLGAHPSAHLG